MIDIRKAQLENFRMFIDEIDNVVVLNVWEDLRVERFKVHGVFIENED